MIELIPKLILSHLIGDYVLQSDYLAQNKGKDYYILFVHCALYISAFYVLFGVTWQLGVLFVLHVIVDYIKAFKKLFPIWVDQLIHYVTLLLYFI